MPKLICLLPVRNGEEDLPGYLASVARFADGIVALDDGSTDRTREILDASPLVRIVLANPVRAGYAGWDDAANRNRLLDAAAELAPEWVISLDADERIPTDDAAALRDFVETEAIPGCAFGFKVYRMWQDLEQYDRAGLWVYRLFSHALGQRFPDQQLHFVPIPTAIPRELWLRTTIRIQHLAGLTAARRQARFVKYEEVDPDNAFQHSYRDLLEHPNDLQIWRPRPIGQPILDVSSVEVAAATEDALQPALAKIVDGPALSVIIISRDDGARLLPTVASVVAQECPWPFEVIVVASGEGNGAALVRERYPNVTVVELPRPAFPGEARNAGLRLARGEFVSFPGSHVELPQGSLAARLRAHDLGYAMVTGTTINGTRTWAGWASYFLDHSDVLPGRPSVELSGAPSHCSYRRSALLAVGGFPETMRAGEDTVVNQELFSRGYQAYRARGVNIIHRSPCRTPRQLLRHHFVRGRGFGRILRDRDGLRKSDLLVGAFGLRFLSRQTVRRLIRTTRNVRRWGSAILLAQYLRAFPLVFAGALAATLGAAFELLRSPLPTDHPVGVSSAQLHANREAKTPERDNNHDAFDPKNEALLPAFRIVAFYGYPPVAKMGILGQHDKDTVLAKLREQASHYVAADLNRPVMTAFEIIASVATQMPGFDGAYRVRTAPHLLDEWSAFAAAHGVLLILDSQPGRAPLADEIDALLPWLRFPHVHLALDPEWAMNEGQVPGSRIGSLDAKTIGFVQSQLRRIVSEQLLPPKLLIVHQFRRQMIRHREELRPVPGVQLVIDVDGFGAPDSKIRSYNSLVRDEPVGFAGIKLNYAQDKPLLTPQQVVKLLPDPDLVIYQ